METKLRCCCWKCPGIQESPSLLAFWTPPVLFRPSCLVGSRSILNGNRPTVFVQFFLKQCQLWMIICLLAYPFCLVSWLPVMCRPFFGLGDIFLLPLLMGGIRLVSWLMIPNAGFPRHASWHPSALSVYLLQVFEAGKGAEDHSGGIRTGLDSCALETVDVSTLHDTSYI